MYEYVYTMYIQAKNCSTALSMLLFTVQLSICPIDFTLNYDNTIVNFHLQFTVNFPYTDHCPAFLPEIIFAYYFNQLIINHLN